jgi:uncharacterized protein YbbK (DUF523 family)
MNPSPHQKKILVSACLLGQNVRYNAVVLSPGSRFLQQLENQDRLVPFCPEVAGGLPVPRLPAEIQGGQGGCVLAGRCQVLNSLGEDVTAPFIEGARQALDLARREQIKAAILKENSPSCGSTFIYNGSFSGKLTPGTGVTTALLERHGIRVYSEQDLPNLKFFI